MLPWILFAIVALYAIVVSLCHFRRTPFPFPDHGSRVFICPSVRARRALVLLLKRHGLAPRFRQDTQLFQRVLFWDRTVISVVATEELPRLIGKSVAGMELVSKNPIAAARHAAEFLRTSGFPSRVVQNPDPDLPKGTLALVASDACPGWFLAFRKRSRLFGPKPPKWEG
ncbi:MAG: hypothetical protein Q8R32_02475 [bacterium]|nr:hypothetical protein [bacterium]